jgi:hypothetical protein
VDLNKKVFMLSIHNKVCNLGYILPRFE